ncbi:O-methyltransferase family 3 protein [Lentinula guzmanii]|uniref:O-methyltransferase family 3 protein n=3 Tax=Lentinula TaxID=5352 RepID=A0AA38MY51_9AGAR|nr:O-methyltransferase family 3 protein [Lentinula guzmanii]KAJ3745861.1 O-methyltransferase family 3 protein [Lentinula detonsa]KAJ3782929.1 O-methyltransferase family 3 protein [Lentinula aff. detonsa]KAJ3797260.1 O-methyltransferase family 3 protein [Lentinula aff. detonsa]KAJ3981828.1 O-methyltransferase family 3 protein [Lentinula detonsa]
MDPRANAPSSIIEWTEAEKYQNSFLIHEEDNTLEFILKNSIAHGLPSHMPVSAGEGKFLNLLIKCLGVKRVLEVGTLGGYSAIWMAKAIPEDGQLVTLELNDTYAQVAKENIKQAGFEARCQVIVGPAHETLTNMRSDIPFDLVFIDADKKSYPKYFREAKRLVKKGGVIIVDNVIRYGNVHDEAVNDENTVGIRKLLADLKEDSRKGEIEATTIPTVGEKGFDGFLYAIRK